MHGSRCSGCEAHRVHHSHYGMYLIGGVIDDQTDEENTSMAPEEQDSLNV